MTAPRPPRLIVKTLAVTFVTIALLLLVVFLVVFYSVRGQVRASVSANLESGQRMFAALETRRQREMIAQAGALSDSPMLKAALDTYGAYARSGDEAMLAQLFTTIDTELRKLTAHRR